MTGVVFDIKELTVHDGDGVRVTVFLKGCPLRCEWCHNPEGLNKEPELLYKKNKCVHCGLCEKPCGHIDCKKFDRCIHICPNDCLTVCGKEYSAIELAEKLNGYKAFFKGDGGVTFSGGEPLLQWDFISNVIDRLDGVKTAIETSGFADKSTFSKMLNKVDFVIMDIKIFDRENHKKYTGVYNDIIKENFLSLKNSGKPYLIRTPIIKGKTDSEENLLNIKNFIGDSSWEHIPENNLANAKRDMLFKKT